MQAVVGFAVALAVVGAFYCWSEALRRLPGSVGQDLRGPRYRAAFMSGDFAKQVVPMGHSGGPVLVSYAVSRETGRELLAAIDRALADREALGPLRL